MNNQDKADPEKVEELSFLEILQLIWGKRRFIIKSLIVFIVAGLVIAFTTPKEWSVSSQLIPEGADFSGIGSSLGGFAKLAGVNLQQDGEQGLNPEIYPDIVKSTPFLLELMSQKYDFKGCSCELTAEEYFTDYIKTSLFTKALKVPFMLLGTFSSSAEVPENVIKDKEGNIILSPSRSQYDIMELLIDRVSASVDEDTGVLSVRVEMQDPVVAASMAQFTIDYLSEYVTRYVLGNEQRKKTFIETQVAAKEREFMEIQEALAVFRDRNQGALNNRAKTELDNLESRYNLEFDLLSGLKQQLAEAEIRVEEKTPVLTVLEPVKVPILRSKPKRAITMIIFAFLGVALPAVYVISKELLIK